MATAYAALVSIMQIIDQLQRHPRPPISLDKQQVQSLTKIVTSLQQFLEAGYNNNAGYSDEADPLEMRIADAAHAVEDVIESHIVDQILADREEISSVDFHRAVQKVIDGVEHVKKEAMEVMKEKMRSQLPRTDSSTAAASSSFDGPEQYRTMVGFDDILIQILDKLTSQGSRRHVISITGMGGMGKTTLAKHVYLHELVVEHFDFVAWVTVSQQYKIRKLLLKLVEGEEQNLSQVDEYELGHILHKKLSGRRYFIIMDDIWDSQVWDRLRVFLPDNNNRSRIMITTRLSNLARQIDDSHNMEMDALDEENSWKLFCKHVFGEEDCPLELQGIGKQIVEGCKGLPLSISVVGGLLAKSKRTKQYWEHIAENLNPTVNLEGDKHCLRILYMSYNNLPIHLKTCFLYIGVVSARAKTFLTIAYLISFFIAEGFVKPISGKSLEETAKEYVIELVERNLVLIDRADKFRDWMYKDCTMHDLLRDLCLRESHKQKFVYVVGEQSLTNIPHSIDSIRRIYVFENTPEEEVLPFLESASHLRSLLWDTNDGETSLLSMCSRLLRVAVIYNLEDIDQKVNLRLIMMEQRDQYRNISSMSHFWNLLTMFFGMDESPHVATAPYEIWIMSQLRFIYAGIPLCLPDPPSGEMDCSIVLENLHTLINVCNFKCSEEVVKRIPHIKILTIFYTEVEGSCIVDYCLNNLGRLQRLQHLKIEVEMQTQTVRNQTLSITFPGSLIMLNLSGTTLNWDDVTTKIGYLPLLQLLTLGRDSCIGAKWETIEGQFCSLRALEIEGCSDLEYWMTENTHFPRLEELCLEGLHKLKEIPSSIGDIPTLQLIELTDCCDSVYDSAQRIKEEQEELGNEGLQVQIVEGEYNSEEESVEDEYSSAEESRSQQEDSSSEHETKNED